MFSVPLCSSSRSGRKRYSYFFSFLRLIPTDSHVRCATVFMETLRADIEGGGVPRPIFSSFPRPPKGPLFAVRRSQSSSSLSYPTKKCIRRNFSLQLPSLTETKKMPVTTPFFGAQKGKKNNFFQKKIFKISNHPSRRLFMVFGRVFLCHKNGSKNGSFFMCFFDGSVKKINIIDNIDRWGIS